VSLNEVNLLCFRALRLYDGIRKIFFLDVVTLLDFLGAALVSHDDRPIFGPGSCKRIIERSINGDFVPLGHIGCLSDR